MTKEQKNALLSLGFYVISLSTVVAIHASGNFKSGPCNPGLDFFSVVILCLLTILLAIVNGVSAFIFKKPTKLSFLIHLTMLVAGIVCVTFGVI